MRLDKPTIVREAKQDINSAMVRVSAETNQRLREIAAEDMTTLQSVIDIAVKEFYRTWFFRRADAAYDALRKGETELAHEVAERKSWDATLLDGIDCEERWREDRTVQDAGTRARHHG
jgi:predicted transcriptional regulator